MAISKEEAVRAWQLWAEFGGEWLARLQIEMMWMWESVLFKHAIKIKKEISKLNG